MSYIVYIYLFMQRSKAEEMRLKASIKKGDGPLTSQLDDLLQTLRVKRQAFHSNSFNGNHVNRMLQASTKLVIIFSLGVDVGHTDFVPCIILSLL